MGTLNVKLVSNQKDLNLVTKNLLKDLKALEHMMEESWFNETPLHIGAEQEICLVDPHMKPKPIAQKVLERIGHHDFTTELAKFNIECNLLPLEFTKTCFSDLEKSLHDAFQELKDIREEMEFETVITGILPTLRKSDMELGNLTPLKRYKALVNAIKKMRGRYYELRIRGIDELNIKHDSAMLEAANTSFQVHLQVAPHDFVKQYNISMAIAAPVLAIASNSPFLFGKRLWSETRIALFQQSVDTRVIGEHLRDRSPRVTFGHHWLEKSILEIYKEDIVRFKTMLMSDPEEDVMQQLEAGKTPELRALTTHNSTVYRWNRPCYGISPNGKPHLRIENRVLPAGPSVVDEVANAAFWLGLMVGFHKEYDDITQKMHFDDARSNFVASAFSGHDTELTWIKGKKISVSELIKKELLPLAKEGLRQRKVKKEDIEKYLGIIEERNATRHTGANWILNSYTNLSKGVMTEARSSTITAAMVKHQKTGKPVHEWSLACKDDVLEWSPATLLIEEFMTRDVFTVSKDDIPELVANIMDWQKVRFIPVEDDKGRLVGLVSSRMLIRHLLQKIEQPDQPPITVGDLMIKNLITITPEKTVQEAMQVMQDKNAACLPVVKNDKLVGIISEGNFLNVTKSLINIIRSKK